MVRVMDRPRFLSFDFSHIVVPMFHGHDTDGEIGVFDLRKERTMFTGVVGREIKLEFVSSVSRIRIRINFILPK